MEDKKPEQLQDFFLMYLVDSFKIIKRSFRL